MITQIKVWDVVQPSNDHEFNLAYMEFIRTGVNQANDKQIKVTKLITVRDESEEVEAEIAIGKDTVKKTWCASAHFNY